MKIVSVIREFFHELYCMNFADEYIGRKNYHIKAIDHRVNIYEYHPELIAGYSSHLYNGQPNNLGDSLGKEIIKYLLDKKGIDINVWIHKRKHFFCVGSNIIGGRDSGIYHNATIWGSGVMFSPGRLRYYLQKFSRRKLDIRAVRGPLTREVLQELGHHCPEVYGDPAILMPLLYTPLENVGKRRKNCVICQFYHEKKFREDHPTEYVISMNTDDYRKVIDEIVSSEIVYSSSLHGIILAETYGVPAVFFRGLSKEIDFKYNDWYQSTGRYDVRLSDSFQQALSEIPPPLPDLSTLQKGLLDTFPYDLWDEKNMEYNVCNCILLK